ncbi:hypothetical protein ANCCEY_07869 [Ancylostoma ceylanicum]|uniref:Uncharacterized protein n=1 Tax=Ancylostoma ceylanicum TaxID=53326 RepID=A0A0D6LMH0_9BILA|nr:hypothetical protein ANCCEY_07869 [Ancylostoma ceylanicum]
MVTRLWIYVSIASIPALGYAVLILSLAVAEMISIKTNPKNQPNLSVVGQDPEFLVIFTISYGLEKRHQKMGRFVKQTAERKVLVSLLWLITIFASTWCTCMLTLVIMTWFEQSQEVAVVQSYVVVFALMAYSVNYYVYFTKNHAYRRVFLEQLEWVFPKRFFAGVYWNETRSQISVLPPPQRRSSPSAGTVSRVKQWKVGNAANSSIQRML